MLSLKDFKKVELKSKNEINGGVWTCYNDYREQTSCVDMYSPSTGKLTVYGDTSQPGVLC